MQNPWLYIKESIAKALEVSINEIEEPLEYGDFAYPCFNLAKKLKKDPREIAKELAEKLKIDFVEIKPIGPYLNFYINWKDFGQKLLKEINKKYGFNKVSKTAVIDFSSPNPAHPFHMGTIRSTILGEALSRILESQGWNVKRFCYINDLGKQASILLLGYEKFGKNKKPEGKPDVWLGKIYFKINQEIRKNPNLEAEAEEILKKYEKGDLKIKKTANKILNWCLEGFKENWKMLRIKFNDIFFESSSIKQSYKLVEDLKAKNLVFESNGALVLKLEPDLPNTIILRSDGTGLYLTRDTATTLWKFKKYNPDLNIWVVAEDQKLHFKQQFKLIDLLGYKEFAKKCYHLAYSMVLLEGKKMSARKGHMILWDDIIKEGFKKALKEVEKRWKLSKKEKEKRAMTIALASIVYFIVKYSPEKIINFSWENALKFEGDTGPYLQYTYARANSILKKAKKPKSFDVKYLIDEKEIKILKLISKYPSILEKSANELKPHLLATYLYELANAFNEFYQFLPVLKAEKKVKNARLKLVEAVKTVFNSGLYLLGIPILEKM
ncbi:MAG: arginine--tRNA ligase [Candidatus Aenigmatarchaeota archaeon]